jgi:hypothetical protein
VLKGSAVRASGWRRELFDYFFACAPLSSLCLSTLAYGGASLNIVRPAAMPGADYHRAESSFLSAAFSTAKPQSEPQPRCWCGLLASHPGLDLLSLQASRA